MSNECDVSVSNSTYLSVQINDKTFTNSSKNDHNINQLFKNLDVNEEEDKAEDEDEVNDEYELDYDLDEDEVEQTQLYDETDDDVFQEQAPPDVASAIEKEPKLKFTVTSQGNPKLFDFGYYYIKDGKVSSNGRQMWKCDRCNVTSKNLSKCGARVHTVNDEIIYLFDPDNLDDAKV